MESTLIERIRGEIDELQATREQLRLQLHLANAELKKRWDEIEARWLELDDRKRRIGSKAGETWEALRALIEEIRSAYQTLRARE